MGGKKNKSKSKTRPKDDNTSVSANKIWQVYLQQLLFECFYQI